MKIVERRRRDAENMMRSNGEQFHEPNEESIKLGMGESEALLWVYRHENGRAIDIFFRSMWVQSGTINLHVSTYTQKAQIELRKNPSKQSNFMHYSCECSHWYISLFFLQCCQTFAPVKCLEIYFFFIHYTLHIQSQLALVWHHSELREEEKYQNFRVIVAAAAIMCMYTISIISRYSLISSNLIKFKSKWSRHSADFDGGAIAEFHDADASWKIKWFSVPTIIRIDSRAIFTQTRVYRAHKISIDFFLSCFE